MRNEPSNVLIVLLFLSLMPFHIQGIKKGKRHVKDENDITSLLRGIEKLEDEMKNDNTVLMVPRKKRRARKLRGRNKFKNRIKDLRRQYRQLEKKRGLAIQMVESDLAKQQQIDDLKDRLANLEASMGKRRLNSGGDFVDAMGGDMLYGGLGLGMLGAGAYAGYRNKNIHRQQLLIARQRLQNKQMLESLLVRDVGMLKKIINDLGTCNSRIETARGNLVYGLEKWITDDYEAKFNVDYGNRLVSKSDSDSHNSDEDEADPEGEERKKHRHKHRHRRHRH